MKISVIIPNLNGADLLSKNLPHVLEAIRKYKDSEIIIADDNSKDNSIEVARDILKSSKIPYKITESSKTFGFSSNINKGIERADGDLLVLLNTDVAPSKEFLGPVISDYEKNKNLFGVGLLDKSIESGKIVQRGRGLAKFRRGFIEHSRGETDRDDTFWTSGGSSVIKRDIVEKIGAFDNNYDPFYWEDIDLSYRARKSGYEIKFERESVVEHRHEEGIIKKKFKDSEIKKIAYRNQFIFVWKNITDLDLIFSHFFWLPYHLLSAIIRTDSAFLAGFAAAVLKLPDILKRRNLQKKFYTKSDKELF